MSRMVVLVVLVLLLVGGLVFLSTVPKEQPTHQIEVPVSQGGSTGGNAH